MLDAFAVARPGFPALELTLVRARERKVNGVRRAGGRGNDVFAKFQFIYGSGIINSIYDAPCLCV